MSCSMDLLNWAEDCYNENLSKGRKLPFDLISRILIERRDAKAIDNAIIKHNKCMAEIVTLFKEALLKPDVGIDGFCYDNGSVDGLWEDFVEDGMPYNDKVFNKKFDIEEDWVEDVFANTFACWFITILNTNLGRHPSPSLPEWYDGRYAINSIWHNNRTGMANYSFFQ